MPLTAIIFYRDDTAAITTVTSNEELRALTTIDAMRAQGIARVETL